MLRAGTPGIPLVKALTERVRGENARRRGLCALGRHQPGRGRHGPGAAAEKSEAHPSSDLERLEGALRRLAVQHGKTVMLGRTLLQPAPPVTFGLKAAGWLGAIRRGHRESQGKFRRALVVQFGGASGTLASLGEQGTAVGRELARNSGWPFRTRPGTPSGIVWRRWCALAGSSTGSLGKMARDLSLLMQGEVGEAAEPGGDGRGGSSTMPHKRNPIGCALTLAAAQRVPGLVATFLSAMVQEHERGVGGWQAEWPTVAAVIQATGLAAASMAEVAEGLVVDPARMRSNIAATHGVIFAERAMMLLGGKLGRDTAHQVLEKATRKSVEEGRRLAEVLSEMPEVTGHLDAAALGSLEVPEQYLGVADEFRERLLSSSERQNSASEKD